MAVMIVRDQFQFQIDDSKVKVTISEIEIKTWATS